MVKFINLTVPKNVYYNDTLVACVSIMMTTLTDDALCMHE